MAKMTELDAAYRATTYRVFLPGGVMDLRVGQANERLNCWLNNADSLNFAIISAYNPGSQRLDAAINAERQSQLECDLLQGNYEPYAGENIPDEASGPLEETCFVVDIALEDACALAEDFGQKAIVYGGADGIPGLVWIEE
ncbi:MAG: hypothetical protein ACD_10C00631G0002 [uncultured bacterium]|nr:MAG: hypothetical protein ACD_10C00631G0002 [uncultured bacterium]